jgi:hypothetical protein
MTIKVHHGIPLAGGLKQVERRNLEVEQTTKCRRKTSYGIQMLYDSSISFLFLCEKWNQSPGVSFDEKCRKTVTGL